MAQAGAPAGRTYTIISFVLSAIAVIFFPIILGPAAIILASVGLSKGDQLGKWALGVAIACTVAGFVIGFLVFEAANN